MHQSIRCQIVRGIHCSTQHAEYHHCLTSRRGEEPSAVVRVVLLLEPHGGASVLLFFLIFDKVHIYSGEGRKTAAQHVMMISINHARIYLGLRASPSVCSRSSSLSRNGGLALCRQLRSVCSHSGPTCQWYAKRKCVDRLAIRVLGFAPSYYSSLRHSLQGALHYDAFLSMHFHHQRDFRRVWFNAQLIRVW